MITMRAALIVLAMIHLAGWFIWAIVEGYASARQFENGKVRMPDRDAVFTAILCATWELTLLPILIGSVIYALRKSLTGQNAC